MLDSNGGTEFTAACIDFDSVPGAVKSRSQPGMEEFIVALRARGYPIRRHHVQAKQHLFRAGQPATSLFLVYSGSFKASVVSEDGREKITGFRLRGDLLGMEALDLPAYACDVTALDMGEVWELPYSALCEEPGFQKRLATAMAGEIRRDWSWMLAIGTLTAEQRVIAFLLDLAARMEALGFSARSMMLRMSRAELGNFLALQLETVTRALSHLHAQGLIAVERREIRIEDPARLRAKLAGGR